MRLDVSTPGTASYPTISDTKSPVGTSRPTRPAVPVESHKPNTNAVGQSPNSPVQRFGCRSRIEHPPSVSDFAELHAVKQTIAEQCVSNAVWCL